MCLFIIILSSSLYHYSAKHVLLVQQVVAQQVDVALDEWVDTLDGG